MCVCVHTYKPKHFIIISYVNIFRNRDNKKEIT